MKTKGHIIWCLKSLMIHQKTVSIKWQGKRQLLRGRWRTWVREQRLHLENFIRGSRRSRTRIRFPFLIPPRQKSYPKRPPKDSFLSIYMGFPFRSILGLEAKLPAASPAPSWSSFELVLGLEETQISVLQQKLVGRHLDLL